MAHWLTLALLAAIALSVSAIAAMMIRDRLPRLSRDPPFVVEREKGRAPGICEYPGDYVPCWCVEVTINTPGGCANAAQYLEDVQVFGQPRFYVPIPE